MDAARNADVVLPLLSPRMLMWLGLHDWVDSADDDADVRTLPPATPAPRALPALHSAGAHAEVLAIPARRRMEGWFVRIVVDEGRVICESQELYCS